MTAEDLRALADFIADEQKMLRAQPDQVRRVTYELEGDIRLRITRKKAWVRTPSSDGWLRCDQGIEEAER
jgi:hypothetical protein